MYFISCIVVLVLKRIVIKSLLVICNAQTTVHSFGHLNTSPGPLTPSRSSEQSSSRAGMRGRGNKSTTYVVAGVVI